MGVDIVEDLRKRKATLEQLDIPVLPTVWLRPMPVENASRSTSKIGGAIAWPEKKDWPTCPVPEVIFDEETREHNDHYIPLAQFFESDIPELPFPADSDVLQLLWCPRFHEDPKCEYGLMGPEIAAFWHSRKDLKEMRNPVPKNAISVLVPTECTFLPLRLDDAPHWLALTEDQRQRVIDFLRRSGSRAVRESQFGVEYDNNLGIVPGTKLLGYAEGVESPVCDCGGTMQHVLH